MKKGGNLGRRYKEELGLLPETVRWSTDLPIDQSGALLAQLQSKPAIFVASGGSHCAAVMLASLHMRRTGRPAMAMTPLQFDFADVGDDHVVWLISAGGSNQDILRALTLAQESGCHTVVLCARPQSALVLRASGDPRATVLAFDLPAGQDGFLATNSLMAFVVLGIRLFGCGVPIARPVEPTEPHLASAETVVVLYAGWMEVVALDLESRFTEAALGHIQIADYRNFAHGRHHWLAKRGQGTVVLALITPSSADLANQTVTALPTHIPVIRWTFDTDEPGELVRGLERSMRLADAASERLGYDPGRPGVPEFGHVIYNLNVKGGTQRDALERAIERKARTSVRRLVEKGALPTWTNRLNAFLSHLRGTNFRAVAFDYDGTLVSTADRFEPITKPMANRLGRLLEDGMKIGVATGRGKSVWSEMRQAIKPEYWKSIVIGYYNGGCIRRLDEDIVDLCSGPGSKVLAEAAAAIGSNHEIGRLCTIEARPTQITVTGSEALTENELWACVAEAVSPIVGVKVVHSSHSVDVIEIKTSKRAVAEQLAHDCKCDLTEVLAIGDRGAWPGNDAEFLALPSGLSVDEVSRHPATCWNLLPPGTCGLAGTLYYCDRIVNGHYTGS